MNRRRFIAAGILLPSALLPMRSRAQSTPVAEPAEEFLIEATELIARLGGDPTVKVVALTPADAFEQAHIAGAAQVDWPPFEIVETSDQRIERWRIEVEALLTELGLAPSDTVVIYDAGTLYAARLWWLLDQLGHERKLVLNGGLGAWQAAGGETTTGPSTVQPAAQPYVGIPNDSAVATLAEVEQALGDAAVVLVDARSAREYVAGHIPGAVNIEFVRNASATGVWLAPAELIELYEAAGVTPDKMVIPYCTTGVRSAVTFFTLRMIGFPAVQLFTGSFKEWSSHPELPVTTGEQP